MRISDWSSDVCASDLEAALLHQRGQLRAEAAGARRLVNDDAAAGLHHRGFYRLDVERQQSPEINHLRVDAEVVHHPKHDMPHGAIGEDVDVPTLAAGVGLAQTRTYERGEGQVWDRSWRGQ